MLSREPGLGPEHQSQPPGFRELLPDWKTRLRCGKQEAALSSIGGKAKSGVRSQEQWGSAGKGSGGFGRVGAVRPRGGPACVWGIRGLKQVARRTRDTEI